ncbi:MAG: feruloyl-CoA synthase [Magnetospiraceae bacterium]
MQIGGKTFIVSGGSSGLGPDFKTIDFVQQTVDVQKREDGCILVKAHNELGPYAERITDRLEKWAAETPDAVFVAERCKDHRHWLNMPYGEALEKVKAIGQFLLDHEVTADRPMVILSGNSVEHLLFALGGMYVGVPHAPISTAYSLISKDFGKLRHIFKVLTPKLIFVDNLGPYRDAIDAVAPEDCHVVALESEHALDNFNLGFTPYADVVQTPVTEAVSTANATVNGKTITKFLFTSGSTGMPKGVINTQEMICANQVMLHSSMCFLKNAPVIVDWLPWSHTFGGNHNVGIVLYNGGTLYIDEGKPAPQLIHHTVDNLAEISPTIYFNVPKGYEFLVKRFKESPEIAKNFFSKLQALFYAGAGLSEHVWNDLEELAMEHIGRNIPILSSLGSTETAPGATLTVLNEMAAGAIGVPYPGVSIKLVPVNEKLELRLKGVTITPGYWRNPEQTEKAYDEEGYYCMGDALKFVDPAEPNRGFLFDGRISEDFKLDTGTWVSVGQLRPKIIHHFAPYVQDVVITGRDRGFIGAMIFPDMAHCRDLIPEHGDGMKEQDIVAHENVVEVFSESLKTFADGGAGSSMRVKRLMLMADPPQIDRHEITDKGSLNQNAVMTARADELEEIYADKPSPRVIGL